MYCFCFNLKTAYEIRIILVGSEMCIGGRPYLRSEENTAGRYSLTVRTPVEGVLFDVLLHESLSHFGRADLRVYGLLEDRPHCRLYTFDAADEEDSLGLGGPSHT